MEERLKEFYIINDTGTDQVVTLEMESETICGQFEALSGEQIMPAGETTKIKFPKDGVYDVYLDSSLVGTAKYYPSLFRSAISYVSAALCGDFSTHCDSKTSCTGEAPDELTNAYSKFMLYVANLATKYDDAVITATTKVRCSSKEEWDDINKQESIMGYSDSSRLLKIQLGHLYMEMYAVDRADTSPADYQELDELYNYAKVMRCISTLGIRDCEPAFVGGVLHEVEFSVDPIEIRLGEENTVTATYKFTANDDTFDAVDDTNVSNVSLAKLNGFTQVEPMTAQTQATEYFITYTYTRGDVTTENTVSMSTIANPPQWFGAESTVDDYAGAGGKVLVSTLKADITNTSPKYQSTSNSTSSNTGTSGKYIWWVTTNPIKFFVGGFEIPVGPWNANCDPNSYAIIHKQMVTVMEDGLTEVTMNYYRTCPLQELYDQTLAYTLNEI